MTTETPEPDTGTDTEQPPASPPDPPHPGMVWDDARKTWVGEPEPRSLLDWKNRARTGEWLLAESAYERGQLEARIEAMLRQQVETLIGPRLFNVADFWHYADLTDVLDDNGNIDRAKVEAVELPAYVKRSPAAPSSAVTSEHAGVDDSQNTPTFGELLRTAARGTRGVSGEG